MLVHDIWLVAAIFVVDRIDRKHSILSRNPTLSRMLVRYFLGPHSFASFKHHSTPECCCWPCPSLGDHSLQSSSGFFQQDNDPVSKAFIIYKWLLGNDWVHCLGLSKSTGLDAVLVEHLWCFGGTGHFLQWCNAGTCAATVWDATYTFFWFLSLSRSNNWMLIVN